MQTGTRARKLAQVFFKEKGFHHGLQKHPSPSSSTSLCTFIAFHTLSPSRQPLCRACIMSKYDTQILNMHLRFWAFQKHTAAYEAQSTHSPIGYVHAHKQDVHWMPALTARLACVIFFFIIIFSLFSAHSLPFCSLQHGYDLVIQQSLDVLQKYMAACAPNQTRARIGSSHGPNVKSKAKVFYPSGKHVMQREGSHEEAYDQGPVSKISADTMCQEDVIRIVEVTLVMWDRFFMTWDLETLIKLASNFIKLAWILLDQANTKGDLATALAFGQRALKVFESHKPSSLKHALCLCVIGYAYKRMGELEKTIEHAEKAAFILQHFRETNGKNDFLALKALGVLVQCKRLLNSSSHESLCHVEKYIKLSEKLSKPGDRDLGFCYQVGGQAYYEANRPYDSLRYCSRALAIFKRHDGSRSSQVALIRHIRSKAYLSLRKYKNSLMECDKARPYLEKAGLEVGNVDLVYLKCLLDLKEDKKAILKLKEMLKTHPKTSCLYVSALALLADVYATQKRERVFSKWCKQAVDAFGNLKPSLKDAVLVRYLGKLQEQQGNYEEGKVLKICTQCIPRDVAMEVAEIECELGLLLLNMRKLVEGLPFLKDHI